MRFDVAYSFYLQKNSDAEYVGEKFLKIFLHTRLHGFTTRKIGIHIFKTLFSAPSHTHTHTHTHKHTHKHTHTHTQTNTHSQNRPKLPRGLRRGSAAARFLGLRVRIPPRAWISLSLVSVVCYQVEVSAKGWSLAQRRPTECGVSKCDREVTNYKVVTQVGPLLFWDVARLRFVVTDVSAPMRRYRFSRNVGNTLRNIAEETKSHLQA